MLFLINGSYDSRRMRQEYRVFPRFERAVARFSMLEGAAEVSACLCKVFFAETW